MRDHNFTTEHNARHLWHPMGHPADSQANPPKIIVGAQDSSITDIDGHTVVDAVGGLWCVNLGYSNNVVKDAISKQLYDLPYYSAFAGSTNPPAIEASYLVREMFADDGMSRVFFHIGWIGFGRNLSAPCASVPSFARRTHTHQIHFLEKGIPWHPFRRRVGEWQQPFPHQL